MRTNTCNLLYVTACTSWDQISDPGTPRFGLYNRYKALGAQVRHVRSTELFSHCCDVVDANITSWWMRLALMPPCGETVVSLWPVIQRSLGGTLIRHALGGTVIPRVQGWGSLGRVDKPAHPPVVALLVADVHVT